MLDPEFYCASGSTRKDANEPGSSGGATVHLRVLLNAHAYVDLDKQKQCEAHVML